MTYAYAIPILFQPPEAGGDPAALDAQVILRDGLPHPDLSPFIGGGDRGITLEEDGSERRLGIPGQMDRDVGAEIEEAIWEKLHFANHLRSERLGEYTVGTDLHRSESLALVQLLILYHLVTAKAAAALGGNSPRAQQAADNAEEEAPSDKNEGDHAAKVPREADQPAAAEQAG